MKLICGEKKRKVWGIKTIQQSLENVSLLKFFFFGFFFFLIFWKVFLR